MSVAAAAVADPRPTVEVKIIDEEMEYLAEGGPKLGPELDNLLRSHIEWWSANRIGKLQGVFGGKLSNYEKNLLKAFLYDTLVNPASR